MRSRPSPAVVDSLARALRLEWDEHEHLRRLADRAARSAPEPPTAPSRAVRPGVRLLLENLRPSPAYVLSRTLDVLAANPGGLHLYAGIDSWPVRQRNLARYSFLHPAARDLFPEWETRIRGCVARLRALAGTDPDAPDLAQLVGELLLRSEDFARLWERYDVRAHRPGTKHFHHPQGRRPHPRPPVHAARRHPRPPPPRRRFPSGPPRAGSRACGSRARPTRSRCSSSTARARVT